MKIKTEKCFAHRKMFRSPFVYVQVMANQEVVTYLSESMLVWACSVRRPEGYRVSQVVYPVGVSFPPLLLLLQALRESTYPCLAMIVLRQHRMVVVGRQEGFIQVQSSGSILLKSFKSD